MDFTKKHCVPCEGGMPPLSNEKEMLYIKEIPKWELIHDGIHKIRRVVSFKNFLKAMEFVNKIATLAESEGHHPDIKIVYSKVTLEIFTHAANGLSENDFILAAKIDQLI